MSETSVPATFHHSRSPFLGPVKIWIAVGVASWAVGLALTTSPPLSDVTTLGWVAVAVGVLVAMVVSLSEQLRPWPDAVVPVATTLTLGGWTALMIRDDRWSLLTFALYSLCFAKGRTIGVALAAFVSAVWLIAWIDGDEPSWRLFIPFAAFAVGAIMSITIHLVGEENESQAALIAELQATREELAASERQRGTLAERARFAGEVHDTLAQGFTSIVLLSRAARRTGDWDDGLASIETTAEENLAAARRLVAAMRPAELEGSTLHEALERQLDTLGGGTTSSLTVVGTPVGLGDATEVAVLRAAQEALLNVRTHAEATTVHLTLSYVGSSVLLDVVDDGVGLTPEAVRDRGSLTGGQGLAAMRQRAESLGGRVDVEAGPNGTAVSMQLPVRST